LPGSIYLLKAGPVSGEAGGPREFFFAWAERVRPQRGLLRAENIQAPICSWEDGIPRLHGARLPEREFSGYAYRMPAPSWFERDGQCPASLGGRRPGPALGRLLHTSPLGRLCRNPEVLLALAQDRLALELAPLLAVPDLLAGEDRLFRDWAVERPGAAAHAMSSCEEILRSQPELRPAARQIRTRLRLAALRRIDLAAVGREVFRPCPAFFGEPHLGYDLGRGLRLKAGIVRMANSWPSAETEAGSESWRGDPELILAAETRLFPLPPPGPGSDELFSGAADAWLALEPLRKFQACTALPVFPHSTVYPHGHVPRGFRIRISPGAVEGCGGTYLTLAAAGLSPYIAEPFDDLCRQRAGLLAEWSRDVAGLAAEKWGQVPAPCAISTDDTRSDKLSRAGFAWSA